MTINVLFKCTGNRILVKIDGALSAVLSLTLKAKESDVLLPE